MASLFFRMLETCYFCPNEESKILIHWPALIKITPSPSNKPDGSSLSFLSKHVTWCAGQRCCAENPEEAEEPSPLLNIKKVEHTPRQHGLAYCPFANKRLADMPWPSARSPWHSSEGRAVFIFLVAMLTPLFKRRLNWSPQDPARARGELIFLVSGPADAANNILRAEGNC